MVRHERPDLEEALGRLVTGLAADRRQLGDLEDKVLRLLRDSRGNILDDEQLVATLNNAKVTSGGWGVSVHEQRPLQAWCRAMPKGSHAALVPYVPIPFDNPPPVHWW